MGSIILKHPYRMNHLEVPTGYSWSYALLGFVVCLSRKRILDAVIGVVLMLLTAGIGQLVLAAFYNDLHIKRLAAEGYVPFNPTAKAYYKKHNMGYLPVEDILKNHDRDYTAYRIPPA